MPKNSNKPVLFRCTTCNFEELITKYVVDFFDLIDEDDPAFPPCFDCQACSTGKMLPVYYESRDGIIYKL